MNSISGRITEVEIQYPIERVLNRMSTSLNACEVMMVIKKRSEPPEIHVMHSKLYLPAIQYMHQTEIPLKAKPYIVLIASYSPHC